MAKIRIKIDPQGNPKILDVCGAGKNCMETTKNFEKMLGQAAENSRQLTDNYQDLDAEPIELTNGE